MEAEPATIELRRSCRRGVSLLYTSLILLAVIAIISLAVDWGRVQVAQAQLQTVADAAARYAVVGLHEDLSAGNAARANARAVVEQNKVDGVTAPIDVNRDVEFGIWNTTTRQFVPTTNFHSANAVRVTLHRTESRGNPIPLTFAALIGRPSASITASSIAVMDLTGFGALSGTNGTFRYYIPATSNPWLAGAPPGTIANPNNPHQNPDYAGSEFIDDGSGVSRNRGNRGSGSSTSSGSSGGNWANWGDYSGKKGSPIRAGNIPVVPGSTITFDGINGGANNFNSSTFYDGDGNTGWIVTNLRGNENGIADLRAPINSVVAVFLSDATPSASDPYPPRLDFSTAAARDYLSLSPQLRQPFFIGDGR
ncbi:MAG: TadG family pilus assembly protein, partial [Phycisphaerales bacterium]|nr:TadG family pilus assembly protein [Phycisphaerales bacterium]